MVRRIYRQFLEGYSPKMIADGLMEDAICTPFRRGEMVSVHGGEHFGK